MPFLTPSFPGRTPVFAVVTSGQSSVPITAVSWQIAVVSGTAFIGNVGPYVVGTRFQADSPLTTAINVGTTGGMATICYLNVPAQVNSGP